MPKQVWMCEKCRRLVNNQEEAVLCEQRHLPIVSAEALTWCKEYWESPFPKTIKVTIDLKNAYNYAIYEIKQIGPKGA